MRVSSFLPPRRIIGDPIQVVIFVAECLHPLPSLLATLFLFLLELQEARLLFFLMSVFWFTDISIVSVIVNHLRSSLTKYLVWA